MKCVFRIENIQSESITVTNAKNLDEAKLLAMETMLTKGIVTITVKQTPGEVIFNMLENNVNLIFDEDNCIACPLGTCTVHKPNRSECIARLDEYFGG